MLTYVLAVLAACANAGSSVLQRKANREAPQRQNLSLKLVWSLAHEPVWFGGVLAVTVGFLLQATALGSGALSVVEPILVLELPATLILASRVFRARMHKREWGSAAAMTAGLAGMLYFLSPSAGRTETNHWYAWAVGIGVNLGFAGVINQQALNVGVREYKAAFAKAIKTMPALLRTTPATPNLPGPLPGHLAGHHGAAKPSPGHS